MLAAVLTEPYCPCRRRRGLPPSPVLNPQHRIALLAAATRDRRTDNKHLTDPRDVKAIPTGGSHRPLLVQQVFGLPARSQHSVPTACAPRRQTKSALSYRVLR